MADTKSIEALVESMPEPDVFPETDPNKKRDDNKLTGPPWSKAIGVYDAILAAGPEGIVAVLSLLDKNYKAEYILHGMAVYLCRPDRAAQRAMFEGSLSGQLAGALNHAAKAFILRTLEVAGTSASVPAIAPLLLDDTLGDPASRTLRAVRAGAPEAFRAALPNAAGRRKVAIIDALAELGDVPSLSALREAAQAPDVEVRLAALWALATLADAGAVPLVIKATSAQGWERTRASDIALTLAERLAASDRKALAAQIYRHLRDTRTDAREKHIRSAASAGLAQLE